jgi:spore coat polysaccharide biosynthesis protein SpsF
VKSVALIQARMSSSRFAGKVLAPLAGVPMIVFMVERARRAHLLDQVVVVTSVDPSDDPLVATLEAHSIDALRGDLNDVLKRFHDAAGKLGATEVVRLTGDCPLVDPAIVDQVIAARRAAGADYASNIDPPTFPDGFDVECFDRAVLSRAFHEATAQPEREHVTLWMRSDAARLRRENVPAIADMSQIRLTVDYPDDLVAVDRVVTACRRRRDDFDLFDVLRCLSAEPEIMQLNPHMRNEALAKLRPASR